MKMLEALVVFMIFGVIISVVAFGFHKSGSTSTFASTKTSDKHYLGI